MIQKKLVIFFIALLLLGINASAQPAQEEVITNNYKVAYDVLKEKIELDQEAQFTIKVKNLKPYSQRFRMQNLATDWDIRTDPGYVRLSGLKILPDTESQFTVFLKPKEDIKLGQHDILFNVMTEGNKQEKLILSAYVEPLSKYKQQYTPSLDISLEVPKKADPREEMNLVLRFDNLNTLDIQYLEILAKSDLIDEEVLTTLSPLEKGKEVKIKKIFDSKLAPQTDDLIVNVEVNNETVKTFKRSFEIIEYTGPFVQKLDKKDGFLSSIGTLIYTNDGNTAHSQTVSLKISFWKNLFTSTEPKAKMIKNPDGTLYLGWDLTLEPGQSSSPIIIKTNYLIFFIVVVIFIFSILYYYLQKSPVIVKKYGISTEKKEGGISEVKITINIKNPTKNPIHKITITDYVPHIADVVNEFKVGTLRPDKILRHETHGDSLVKWELEGLDAYEDRILTYRIRPKLSILGEFVLKPTVLKYHKKGKTVRVESNSVTVIG